MRQVMWILALANLFAACKGEQDQAPAAPERPSEKPTEEPADTPRAPEAVDTSKGSCRVQATGGVTFDQTSGNSGKAINVWQWYTPSTRAKLGGAETGFIINCLGDDIRLNIISSRGAGTFGPKPYTVGGRGAGVKVMGQIGEATGRKDASIMQAKGTLDITAFDELHLAGTLEVTVKTLPDRGEIKLNAIFDFPCTNHDGCK